MRARSGGTAWSIAAILRGGARSLLRLLRGDLLAHLLHVERLRLLDDLLERVLRERAGLREHDDRLAEHHERRDRPDLEVPGDLLLVVRVHLGEDDIRILLGHALEDRRESAARAAPRRP